MQSQSCGHAASLMQMRHVQTHFPGDRSCREDDGARFGGGGDDHDLSDFGLVGFFGGQGSACSVLDNYRGRELPVPTGYEWTNVTIQCWGGGGGGGRAGTKTDIGLAAVVAVAGPTPQEVRKPGCRGDVRLLCRRRRRRRRFRHVRQQRWRRNRHNLELWRRTGHYCWRRPRWERDVQLQWRQWWHGGCRNGQFGRQRRRRQRCQRRRRRWCRWPERARRPRWERGVQRHAGRRLRSRRQRWRRPELRQRDRRWFPRRWRRRWRQLLRRRRRGANGEIVVTYTPVYWAKSSGLPAAAVPGARFRPASAQTGAGRATARRASIRASPTVQRWAIPSLRARRP